MVKRMPVAQFKSHLAEALRDVEAGDRVVIERRGRAVAVLVPVGEAAATGPWLEELEGLMDGVDDYDAIMRDVVRSRERQKSRPVDLG
ncbi:MAG: type II toxin-antitoxin system Phd/YefM family antitoxin [Myxococcota bacterium]